MITVFKDDVVEINVKLYSVFKKIAGRSHVVLQFEEKPTVNELVKKMCSQFGKEFLKNSFDKDGNLKMVCLVNGKSQKKDFVLKNGDKVVIISSAGGG